MQLLQIQVIYILLAGACTLCDDFFLEPSAFNNQKVISHTRFCIDLEHPDVKEIVMKIVTASVASDVSCVMPMNMFQDAPVENRMPQARIIAFVWKILLTTPGHRRQVPDPLPHPVLCLQRFLVFIQHILGESLLSFHNQSTDLLECVREIVTRTRIVKPDSSVS
jgi:hypothetical protein